MTDGNDIKIIKEDIAYIKRELRGFFEATNFENDNTTYHIVSIYKYLKALNDEVEYIHDVIGPRKEKVFSKVREARRELWATMEQMEKRSSEKSKPKKH